MKQNTASVRIAAQIKQQIRSGRLAPGTRVPSAREIVREHRVALATASRVLGLLRSEGLVKVQPGIGTIVRGGERARELSREQVVRAAIAIADEEGLHALSLRQVALEVGMATVALGRLFESLEELSLAMADTVLGDIAVPRDSEDWRATLTALARAQWAGYAEHPWLVEALSMTRPQLLPNGMKHTEQVLNTLEPLGLGPVQTLRTGIALLAYIRGMAVGLEPELRAEQDSGLSREEWLDARDALFTPFAVRFPTLGRLARQRKVDMSLDALFERGLELFFDGIAAGIVKPRLTARQRVRRLVFRPGCQRARWFTILLFGSALLGATESFITTGGDGALRGLCRRCTRGARPLCQ